MRSPTPEPAARSAEWPCGGRIAVDALRMSSSSERKAFKEYFDRAAARALADQVEAVHPAFDGPAFVRRATRGLADLEFQGRVWQFADSLAAGLPADVPRALAILTESLPPALPDCEAVTDGWLQWPVGHFIARYAGDHFEDAMIAMEALTQRFSSEFAVRPFVEAEPERTFRHLGSLTSHPSPHVRRWCSEGVRPRLPWGRVLSALVEDPTPIWPILEALRDDPERYVLRSVANNINDIARDHPDLVIEHMKAWSTGGGASRRWCIGHGLRTLVKQGRPGALALLGYDPPERLAATLTVDPEAIAIGGHVHLHLDLATTSPRKQPVVIDYVVEYVRTRGRTAEKVFKWRSAELAPRSTLQLTKRHPMRPTTIRALYPGTHRVSVQVNGERVAEGAFELNP